AHHRPARRDHARRARDEDGAQPRLLPEVAPDRLLRDHHLDHAGEDQGRNQARDDEPEQGEAVAGAHRREARILRVRDECEDDGQRGENHEGNVEESGPRHGGIIRHVGLYAQFHTWLARTLATKLPALLPVGSATSSSRGTAGTAWGIHVRAAGGRASALTGLVRASFRTTQTTSISVLVCLLIKYLGIV